MKEIKIEWCENFIRAAFTKHHPFPGGGIEVGCFFKMAEAAGLWERDTYGSPMSKALSKMAKVEMVYDNEGNFLYHIFKLA